MKKQFQTQNPALWLSFYFENLASFWLGLQMDYDLEIAEDAISFRIHTEVKHMAYA